MGATENSISKQAQYDNCISLGWFCGTATAMAMYGLRSKSGPFDWYYSDLDSVLKVIETDFSDFMLKENLQVNSDKPKEFSDTKYGFWCNHDIKIDFEQEYHEIYEKYCKRALRFMEDVKRPTCFLRAVRSEQEISYIKENRDYIYKVIKKGNPDNEIIFLLLKDMTDLPDDFLWFRLDIACYIGEVYEMRTMFDSSEQLIKYCQNNILSEEKIKDNMFYEKKSLAKKSKNALVMHRIEKDDNSVAKALRDYFPNIEQGIYLWGAGFYGTPILRYMLEQGIKINAIIDNDDEKIGTMTQGVSIISFSELKQDSMNIFIAIYSEEAVNAIVEQINDKHPNSKILTLGNLYGYPGIPELSWY